MASEIDAFAILGAMAKAPSVFEDIRLDVAKAAETLVVKQLKAKALDYRRLRGIQQALGPACLVLILDKLKDADVKGLATRLDKNHPEIKTMTLADHRRLIVELAGDREPAEKAPKRPATKKPASTAKKQTTPRPQPTEDRTLSSKAMAARSPRRKATSES